MDRRARRRFGLLAFALLLVLHALAGGVYLLNERQYAFLGLWRDGREASRAGRHAAAAVSLRAFAGGYRAAIRPVLLRRDFPGEAQAWLALGRTERELGSNEAALAAFSRAAALGDEAAWHESHLLLFALRDAARLEGQAIRRLGADVLRDGRSITGAGDPGAWQDLAASWWLRGELPRAVAAYEQGLVELPRWLIARGRPPRAADGGVVDEVLALRLLAGSLAWLGGDALKGEYHCSRLAAQQDREHPVDGLCRAAKAVARREWPLARQILEETPLAPGEQAALAAILSRRSDLDSPASQSGLPSPAPATRPRR